MSSEPRSICAVVVSRQKERTMARKSRAYSPKITNVPKIPFAEFQEQFGHVGREQFVELVEKVLKREKKTCEAMRGITFVDTLDCWYVAEELLRMGVDLRKELQTWHGCQAGQC